MYGHVLVEADNIDDAMEKAYTSEVGLPEDGSYVNGTFELDEDLIDEDEEQFIVKGD
jgi:hypothetical protein